jgi:D-glycerate 3-kinase
VSPDDWPLCDAVEAAVRAALRMRDARPLVVGICGAQGSGKSTLAAALAARMQAIPTALLSLDDLYLTHAERERLAREVHPLLLTRGVPGTHDVALGLDVLDRLGRGEAVPLPRFDKASDDRAPAAQWPSAPAGTGLLILEGWCVGARPQPEAALAAPVNALEREEDREGIWRRYVNRALAEQYPPLFDRVDLLVFLAAPSWEVVRTWRTEQEHELRRRRPGAATMSDGEIGRFVQYYERLTRYLLAEMPARADLVAELGEDRALLALHRS